MSDDLTSAVSWRWVKSSRSTSQGQCVEAAGLPDRNAVRDSKLGDDSPILTVPRGAFAAFIEAIKADRLG